MEPFICFLLMSAVGLEVLSLLAIASLFKDGGAIKLAIFSYVTAAWIVAAALLNLANSFL